MMHGQKNIKVSGLLST